MLLDEWKALKARIDGLALMAQMAITAHSSQSGDAGMQGPVKREAANINLVLDRFLKSFDQELPLECKSAISQHVARGVEPTVNTGGNAPLAIANVVTPFIALSSTVTYLLADTQHAIHRLAERAFMHLQRTIESNPAVRVDWKSAFEDGETRCEQLGATALLLHGIFAFKVNAAGARTDLVFPEPLRLSDVALAAEGLVLTEWKLVRDPTQAIAKGREAREQTRLYASSALGGVELRSYRYIVLVSLHALHSLPEDCEEGGIKYRHINVQVDPETPSQVAKGA